MIGALPGSRRAAGTAGNRRVVRGGSFNNTEDNARCAYRNNRNPNNRNDNNGFRVWAVAAHSSLGRAQRLSRKCRSAMAWRPRRNKRESAACPWPQSRACGPVGSGEYQLSPAPGMRRHLWAGALSFTRWMTAAALHDLEIRSVGSSRPAQAI